MVRWWFKITELIAVFGKGGILGKDNPCRDMMIMIMIMIINGSYRSETCDRAPKDVQSQFTVIFTILNIRSIQCHFYYNL